MISLAKLKSQLDEADNMIRHVDSTNYKQFTYELHWNDIETQYKMIRNFCIKTIIPIVRLHTSYQ